MVPDRTGDFSIAASRFTVSADGRKRAAEKPKPPTLAQRAARARKPGKWRSGPQARGTRL